MNKVSEVALFTPNVDELVALYTVLLGTEPNERVPGKAVFRDSDFVLLIHDGSVDEDHIALTVPDLDRAAEAARAAGAEVEGPADYPWGRAAYVTDPDGRRVELHEGESISY